MTEPLFTSLEDDLWEAVHGLFPGLDPDKIVIGYQNVAEPVTPYVSIEVVYCDPVGFPSASTRLEEDGTMRYRQEYQAQVRIRIVGKDSNGTSNHAGNYAHTFDLLLNTEFGRRALYVNNLSLMKKNRITRVPDLRDTDYYNHYIVDCIFSYAVEITQILDGVDSIEVSGNYQELETLFTIP